MTASSDRSMLHEPFPASETMDLTVRPSPTSLSRTGMVAKSVPRGRAKGPSSTIDTAWAGTRPTGRGRPSWGVSGVGFGVGLAVGSPVGRGVGLGVGLVGMRVGLFVLTTERV